MKFIQKVNVNMVIYDQYFSVIKNHYLIVLVQINLLILELSLRRRHFMIKKFVSRKRNSHSEVDDGNFSRQLFFFPLLSIIIRVPTLLKAMCVDISIF